MIPICTHRVTVLAAAEDLTARDSYDDPPTWTTLAAGVRAVIAAPGGQERTARAQAETITASFQLDPFDGELSHLHRLQDDTGVLWEIVWTAYRPGLGLDHWTGELVRYDGQEP